MNENQIYTTTDYNDFVFKKENRSVDEKHVDRIAESMNINGWLGAPIEVSISFDGKMQIEDGQHRYCAAKKTNTPIRFFVGKARNAYEQAELNNMIDKWQPMKFIEMYARNGLESYVRLYDLCVSFPDVALSEIKIAIGKSNSEQAKQIKEGVIEISEERYINARKVLNDIAYLKQALNEVGNNNKHYVRALMALLKIKAIDRDRMAVKIKKYHHILNDVSTTNGAVDYLERVYNYNMKKDVVYLVDKYKKAKRAKLC